MHGNLLEKNEPHLFFEIPKRLEINFERWFICPHFFFFFFFVFTGACLVSITSLFTTGTRENFFLCHWQGPFFPFWGLKGQTMNSKSFGFRECQENDTSHYF
jgi:hypothetical protein